MKRRIIMKKFISLLLITILSLSLFACGSNEKSNEESSKESSKEKEPLTAEQIVEKLKTDYDLPIVQELTYDEETDVNGLLGRPGQYTSKTNWNDERDTESVNYQNDESMTADGSDFRACTVEVFATPSDANDRKEYIESTWENNDLLSQDQYIYLVDTALLRIPYNLTPDQAAEYEDAFNKIMKQ